MKLDLTSQAMARVRFASCHVVLRRQTMTLEFPNLSRSYDATLRQIRFSAYDGVFEVPFFVEVEALVTFTPQESSDEGDYLSAFDKKRELIQDVARRAYKRGRNVIYVLKTCDFE